MPNANLENFVLCDVTVYGFIIIAGKKKKKQQFTMTLGFRANITL